MMPRDKAIIADLERFRCLTRDDVAELHFANVKNPINETNKALLRLRRMGCIGVSKEQRKYLYFPDKSIKKDSSKIGHFLAIAAFYREIRTHDTPFRFEVEPKLGGKGLPEPDIFMIWKKTAFYVEIQNSVFSAKVMQAKMLRYESFYAGGEWQRAEWQPKDKKVSPIVWIMGKGDYDIKGYSFRILQGSVEKVLSLYNKPQ